MPSHAEMLARIKSNINKTRKRLAAAAAKRKSRAIKKAKKSKKSNSPVGLKALGIY